MLGYVLSVVAAVVIAVGIVWSFFMDHSEEETYVVGFHYTPDADPDADDDD